MDASNEHKRCYLVDLQVEERKVVLEVSGQLLSFSSMLPYYSCCKMKSTWLLSFFGAS